MEREEVNLAAIMFTDIAGYTSLTESDEGLALKLLDQHRKIVRPIVSEYHGKEVKTMGDAFLVEFSSAVEAIRCALRIQESLHSFNGGQKQKERIFLRIGIHLGDIIHSNHDVYGEAVNVASRIEKFSDAGGISLSRQVYDSVHNRIHEIRFESLGVQQLKNVSDGLEMFRVSIPWGTDIREAPTMYRTSPDEDAQPRNRIAVLPFVNIGPDTSDEFFADGLTEELISKLSQTKELKVIARTSAMNYKNERQKKIRDIGRELGVGTIVEGSVRKAGVKLRVTVQVVDASNEEHLWASTYDRNLDDIFQIQTDIANRVADTFSSDLAPLIHKRISALDERSEPEDVTAYTCFLRGRHLLHSESETSANQALQFFNRAIEEDPNFARAYVGRGECHFVLTEFGHLPFVEGAKKAESDIRRAIEIDPENAEAHAALAHAKYALDEFSSAEREAKRAIELNPSLADAYHALGHLEWVKGKAADATKLFEIAYKLDPLEEENIRMLGEVYLDQGREEDALKLTSATEHLFPQVSCATLTGYYIMKGDYGKALESFEKYRLVSDHNSIFVLGLEGVISALMGEREKALQLISEIENSSGSDTVSVNSVGMIYYALGDYDKFFEYLRRAMEIHALPLGNLINSPLFADARKDPRLRKILEKLDLEIDLSSLA